MSSLKEKLDNIDVLKKKLDKLRPLNVDTEEKLREFFDNAIIRNSTLGKCNNFIDYDAHKEALDYIYKLSEKNLSDLNRGDILKIHGILFHNICPNYAAKYRDKGDEWVSLNNGEQNKVCDFSEIPDRMDRYFDWLFSPKNEHPIIIAAEAHNKFVSIHPFIDGNGRTGRLIMNLLLLQNGYVPIIIKSFKRTDNYDDGIKLWQNGEKDFFYNFIADCERESLEEYLSRII